MYGVPCRAGQRVHQGDDRLRAALPGRLDEGERVVNRLLAGLFRVHPLCLQGGFKCPLPQFPFGGGLRFRRGGEFRAGRGCLGRSHRSQHHSPVHLALADAQVERLAALAGQGVVLRALRNVRPLHPHQPGADEAALVGGGDLHLFLVVDVVHAASGVVGRIVRVEHPGPPSSAVGRDQFQVEVVDQGRIGVERGLVVVPGQADGDVRVLIGDDEVEHVHLVVVHTFLAEGFAADEVHGGLDVHLAVAPLVVGAGVAEVVGGLHEDGFGG